jgi:hypothetical protein
VDHGLFLEMADVVLVQAVGGIRRLERRGRL